MACNHAGIFSTYIYYSLFLCFFCVSGKASEVVEFVVSLECQVLRTILQLFDRQLDVLMSVNTTDEQKIPEMLLTTAEMVDRFKKVIVTSVNFVLFSG